MLDYVPIIVATFAFICVLWQLAKRIMIPVNHIRFDSYNLERRDGSVRMIDKHKLKPDKGHPLYRGNNDFYVTVQGNEVKYHSRYVLDTITPIIRDAEDILFFRIQVKTIGGKVRKFRQTNLSKPNVTLHWRTKEE